MTAAGDDHDHDHERAGGMWARFKHAVSPHTHDAADSIDAALTSSARGIRAVKISLVGLALTAALQLVVVAFSGSVALLADTKEATHFLNFVPHQSRRDPRRP